MKRNRSKLGTKKGVSPISTNTRNGGSGDAYYRGPSSSEKEPAHEGQSRNVDGIATKPMTPETARTTHDPPSNTNGMILEPNQAPPPIGAVLTSCDNKKINENSIDKIYSSADKLPTNAAPSFQFFVKSEEGLDLIVDLNSTPSAWAQSVLGIHIDENSCLTPAMEQEIVDIPIGKHLTLGSETYKEALMDDEPVEETSIKDLNCGDKLPNSCQPVVSDAKSGDNHCVDGNFDHTSPPPSSASSAGDPQQPTEVILVQPPNTGPSPSRHPLRVTPHGRLIPTGAPRTDGGSRVPLHAIAVSRVSFQFQLSPVTTHPSLILATKPQPHPAAAAMEHGSQNPSGQLARSSGSMDRASATMAPGGMDLGRGGGETTMEVVEMEDAVKMLVEHLVRPVLPRGARRDESNFAPEKQRTIAQQIHTAVVLYNYYHRKMSPQLAFADAKRFFTCAALSVGEDLLAYLSMVHEHGNTSGEDVRFSVTDRAAMDACEIAEALNASKDSPNISLWPISKVAVILLNPTSKKCLVEYGPNTKGVWSFIEKETDAAAGNSHSSSQPTGQESTNKASSGTSDGPYMLQQLAYSELESRTGIKRSNLRVLDEDLAYSLSKKWTTTKVFVLAYEESMKSNLVEIPLEELIRSMTGPVFTNDPFLTTSTVVDYYHILPYKDILFELLHRKWPSDSRINDQLRLHGKCSLHSVIDETLEEQEANSKSKMQKRNSKVSTPKPNKQVIKPTGTNSNHNNSISKYKKNNKRKYEASRATASVYAEDQYGVIPTEGNDSLVLADVETSKPVIKPMNAKATATTAAKSGLQMDKNKTKKQSTYGNIPQDDVATEAPCVDPVIKNGGLEGQTVEASEKSVSHNPIEVSEKSGGTTENKNGQIYDSLQSIWKRQDDVIHKQCMLEERNAQYDMDIQTILSEGEMTPKVMSIIDKYKDTSPNMVEVVNSYCSGESGQTLSTKRKKLKEATLLHNPCQELDKICRGNNWILPRYTILPSVAAGMFHARVRLTGVDFDTSVDGDQHMTPREARCSAAANMIFELHKKAREEATRAEQPE